MSRDWNPVLDGELERRLARLPLLDLPEAAADRQEEAALAFLARRRRQPSAWAWAAGLVGRVIEPLLMLLLGGGYLLSTVCRALAAYGLLGTP